jgi:oxaloacetate decarboxylase alpha subunit
MSKLFITDTILRDAHQSQAATRMRIEDMLPACEVLDSIGYWSLEVWGGATFDACLRFLNEDPWDRLRKLRKALPNTKLQMLFRGQNILGIQALCRRRGRTVLQKAIENGIALSVFSTRSTISATSNRRFDSRRSTAESVSRP